jgi:hypothetical protein
MSPRPSLFCALLALASAPTLAQTAPAAASSWAAFKPLLGDWVADPSPDGATGGFSFVAELEGRVVVRKNHAEFAKSGERPAQRHLDLLVMFKEGETTRATFWDNEGHVIDYVVTVEGEKFTFVSRAAPDAPSFRLTYEPAKKGGLSVTFELAPPGTPAVFRPYLKGTAHRAP